MSIFEQLKAGRLEGLQKLVAEKEEETQILEFKEIFDLNSKEGKRKLSKHISGMANGAGGVFVIGIRTKKKNNIDVADSLHPIADCENYALKLKAAIGLYASPQIENIEIQVIDGEKSDKSGFLLMSVPMSSLRPHMATAERERRYYRRGLDGTRMMDHQQIRDMFLSDRSAALDFVCIPKWVGNSGENLTIEFQFTLSNIGRVAAKNPFLRVTYNPSMTSMTRSHQKTRRNLNTVSYFLANNPILHVGEHALFANPSIFFTVKSDTVRRLASNNLSAAWLDPRAWEFRVGVRHPSIPDEKYLVDKIELKITYGAENCPSTEIVLSFDESEIIEVINEESQLEKWGSIHFQRYKPIRS